MTNKRITVNKIKCLTCQDVIESKHRHDYKDCKCGAVGVDGGLSYLRRLWDKGAGYEELSEYADEEGTLWATPSPSESSS